VLQTHDKIYGIVIYCITALYM